jgi:hypothetical protein
LRFVITYYPIATYLEGGQYCPQPPFQAAVASYALDHGNLSGVGARPALTRILFNVCPNPVEFYTGSNQTVKAFLLPERPMSTEEKIGLVSRKSLEGTQPLAGNHMRCCQQMNMIRHHDERMELIPPECAISVSQRCHHHFCNFRLPQKQRSIRARVQEPVDGHKCPARRNQSLRWEHTTAGKTTMQPERDKQRAVPPRPSGAAAVHNAAFKLVVLLRWRNSHRNGGRPILAAAAFQAAKPAKSRLRA